VLAWNAKESNVFVSFLISALPKTNRDITSRKYLPRSQGYFTSHFHPPCIACQKNTPPYSIHQSWAANNFATNLCVQLSLNVAKSCRDPVQPPLLTAVWFLQLSDIFWPILPVRFFFFSFAQFCCDAVATWVEWIWELGTLLEKKKVVGLRQRRRWVINFGNLVFVEFLQFFCSSLPCFVVSLSGAFNDE
jgi:hypothetical protein